MGRGGARPANIVGVFLARGAAKSSITTTASPELQDHKHHHTLQSSWGFKPSYPDVIIMSFKSFGDDQEYFNRPLMIQVTYKTLLHRGSISDLIAL